MNQDQVAYLENMRKALEYLKLAAEALVKCNSNGEQFDFANSSDSLVDWVGDVWRALNNVWYQTEKRY